MFYMQTDLQRKHLYKTQTNMFNLYCICEQFDVWLAYYFFLSYKFKISVK